MKYSKIIRVMLTLIIITYSYSLSNPVFLPTYAQQDLQVINSKNLQVELDENLKTNAQLSKIPVNMSLF
jgi:hypothetical protein